MTAYAAHTGASSPTTPTRTVRRTSGVSDLAAAAAAAAAAYNQTLWDAAVGPWRQNPRSEIPLTRGAIGLALTREDFAGSTSAMSESTLDSTSELTRADSVGSGLTLTRELSAASTLVDPGSPSPVPNPPRPQPQHPAPRVPEIPGRTTHPIPPGNTLVVPLSPGIALDICHPYAVTVAVYIQIFNPGQTQPTGIRRIPMQTRPIGGQGRFKKAAIKIARVLGHREMKVRLIGAGGPTPAVQLPAQGVIEIPRAATIAIPLSSGTVVDISHPYGSPMSVYLHAYEPAIDFPGETRMRREQLPGRAYPGRLKRAALEVARAVGRWGSQPLD
jgi:hypothetical protein